MVDQNKELTRREFLKSTALTAAALSIPSIGVFSSARADTIGPDDTINAAIIGVGSQGSYLLQRAVKVPNAKWLAVCDIQEKNLNGGLRIAKGAQGYKDYREVLDRKDIQAVIIAVPIGLHASMTIDALRAGKHVFCEKMMAYTIEDAKKMYRTSRQTGRKLQIGHQRRYDPQYQHTYNMIKNGDIGKITHIRAQWNRNASWRRPCPDSKLEDLINWRLYRKSSQGLMAELGSHQIDVVNWILGESPSAVVGIGGLDYWKDGRDIYDNVQVIFEYPSGVKFTYQSITTNQFDGAKEQIMGNKGTVIIEPGRGLLYQEPGTDELAWADVAHKAGDNKGIVLDASKSPRLQKEEQKGTSIEGNADAKKDDYLLELEDFFKSVRDGHEPLCSPKVALATCIAAIKANEAMDTQKKVVIPEELYKV